MSIKKFKVLNIRDLPLGLSDALGLSELVLDAPKTSTERRFFRQERVHSQHGCQRIDYYPDEKAACIECLDTISFLNILEEIGLNSSVASSIPQAVIEDALLEAAAEDEIRQQELSDFWKAAQHVRGL
ncbi:hypothetical protein A2661_03010 [Candidatus Giovannonibacteria bacterium RIFCSPHIGHO2_01_FULL_45_24]|uniref:Uncharacterized protein n=1 Tax=Candidatus Giovannonibacteria bacterium RIFCSPLOWO2_01_FULL_46_32 TaxID=1798353 RepID=A0A1F5XGB2_9BACT|nr:MAG: hypothetical protein A2661_03010 [Candidatus Giovannonibacteria bacterium RIFCSPHIGHO2_01_FULL_45_24]OGF86982.1 MAG: hypothetical protein A3B19_00930 [Candidatus Giovannonibacteria bacterium RIFCSPLOWO2_01_FULL_46_32]